MVGLVRSTRYVLALASPAPPAPLPRSGFVHRPQNGRSVATRDFLKAATCSWGPEQLTRELSRHSYATCRKTDIARSGHDPACKLGRRLFKAHFLSLDIR